MTTSHYAPSSYDWPPRKISPPQTFENTDLYPAVTIKATRTRVEQFGDVVEQEDELGICSVAYFEVIGTLIMFYQSALDTKDRWTVFVDMRACVANEQLPTRLGDSVVRRLTAGSIKPEWVNTEADTEYRSRRRKPSSVDKLGDWLTTPGSIRSLFKNTGTARPLPGLANKSQMMMGRGASSRSGQYLAAKEAATFKKAAMKKATAPAKKAVTAKKAAAPKKSAAKKASPSKK